MAKNTLKLLAICSLHPSSRWELADSNNRWNQLKKLSSYSTTQKLTSVRTAILLLRSFMHYSLMSTLS